MAKQRVALLDGFRFLAIIAVMLIHYTCRYRFVGQNDSLYPYGNFYGTAFLFGTLGVQFFFIISGFVISFTLENTNSLSSFWKNRFIRLFPAMLLCSILTLMFCRQFDTHDYFPGAHEAKNLLPALTFLTPRFWSLALKRYFDFLSGSYWSLWPEIQFYFISAGLYFLNRKNFFRNLVCGSALLYCIYFLQTHFYGMPADPADHGWRHVFWVLDLNLFAIFNIFQYICWFTMGAFFYHLYKKERIRVFSITALAMALLFFFQLFFESPRIDMKIMCFVMPALFVTLVYKPNYLRWLENPVLRRIGVISYSMYLIHEVVGVLLIHMYGGYLGKWSPLSPFVIMIAVVLFAELSNRYFEMPVGNWLKRLLFRNRQISPVVPIPAHVNSDPTVQRS